MSEDIVIDKARVLHKAIAEVEESLRRLGSEYAVAKQATLESPHVMKSKREVTGIESSYLANALAENIQERQVWLQMLRQVRLPEAPRRASLGCVVRVGRAEGLIEQLYFILPACGGMEISLGDGIRTVRIITPETPVARALIGKCVGDDVELQGQGAQSVLAIL